MKETNKTVGKTTTQSMGVTEMQKKYVVLLTRYPEKFEVMASNEGEARAKARHKVNWSIWESIVEEVDAFENEISEEKKYGN